MKILLMPWRFPASLALAAALVSCGGGGGSAGGGGGSPSAPTGLVPSAPTPGVVLATNATDLRVLRPNAVWTYRGLDQLGGLGSPATVYSDVVQHAADPRGTVENSANVANEGADSSVLISSGGIVKTVDTIDFTGTGKPETFDEIELRSPVRVDDQYVLYDKHFDDGGADFDGDGRHDALDVAAWRRVIGEEVLDLHNRRQVSAVRVDATLVARVQYTRDGTFSDVVRIVQSTWYARGIGIVQVRVDRPNQNVPTLRHVSTEQLLTWDGLTEGLGPMPVQAGVVPAGFESAGAALDAPLGAVAFDDHVVVGTQIPGTFPAAGFALSQLDLRGRIVASRNYRASDFGDTFAQLQNIWRVGNEIRVMVLGFNDVYMVSFDATGQARTTTSRVVVVPGRLSSFDDRVYFRAVGGTDRFWLMWATYYDSPDGTTALTDLKVQAFDPAGQALGGPAYLEQGAGNFNMLAARLVNSPGGPVFATWSVNTASGYELRYGAVDPVTGVLLARKTAADTGFLIPNVPVEPAALGPGYSLTAMNFTTTSAISGVQLDNAFDPVRSSGGPFDSERILPAWSPALQSPFTPAGAGGRLFFGGNRFGPEFPEDSLDSALSTFLELTPSGGPLTAPADIQLLGQFPVFSLQPLIQLPLTDRVLVIGTVGQRMSATTVWRVRQS